MCGRKLFSKCKRLYKRLRVVPCDCLGDRCRWCYFWKMQVACRRAQSKLDRILLSFHCSLKLSVIIWSTRLPVCFFFRASTVLLVQCTSNFGKKLKFTEVYVLFQKFFWYESQPVGPITKIGKRYGSSILLEMEE